LLRLEALKEDGKIEEEIYEDIKEYYINKLKEIITLPDVFLKIPEIQSNPSLYEGRQIVIMGIVRKVLEDPGIRLPYNSVISSDLVISSDKEWIGILAQNIKMEQKL